MRGLEKFFPVYRNIVRGIAATALLALAIAALRGFAVGGGVDRLKKTIFYADRAFARAEKAAAPTPSGKDPSQTPAPEGETGDTDDTRETPDRKTEETPDRATTNTEEETADDLLMLFPALENSAGRGL